MTDPIATIMSDPAPLGRVAAPPDREATSGIFYFWVDRDQSVERTQIVRTQSTVGGRPVRFVGVVQEVYRRSRQRDVHEEAARFDGRTAERPPFDSEGVTYAEAAILRTTPVAHTPPTEESEVLLGAAADAAKGYGFDRVRDENRLPIGQVRNGGVPFAGPAVLDLAYLLGENGGHLNVNGIAGMGAKSSFLLHVILPLLAWARRTDRPGDPSRPRIVPIIFNVKNFDLFFIDRWNKNWRPEYAADWRELGIDRPVPFEHVEFRAPRERNSDNPIRTGRDGVTAYSWGLADVIEQGLFRYLFADDDLGSPTFGTLVGAIEERLTFDSADGPRLWRDGPQTFDALLDWIRDPNNHHALGEPHPGKKRQPGPPAARAAPGLRRGAAPGPSQGQTPRRPGRRNPRPARHRPVRGAGRQVQAVRGDGRLAHLLRAGPLRLAGARVRAAHQATVGEEAPRLGEAGDVVDLVQQGQPQDRPDPGHRPHQPDGDRVVDPGVLDQVPLQLGEPAVVAVDHRQVGGDHEPGARVGEAVEQLGRAVGRVGQLLRQGRPVELGVGVDNVGDQLGPLPDEEAPPAEQVAGLAFGFGVGVGQGEQPAAEHGGQLAGVDLVALALRLVDVPHGQGAAEGEGQALLLAQVGQPVPGEHALGPDDQILAVRLDGLQEGGGFGGQVLLEDGLPLGVQDVGEHGPGVQIDADVDSVLATVVHVSCPRR